MPAYVLLPLLILTYLGVAFVLAHFVGRIIKHGERRF